MSNITIQSGAVLNTDGTGMIDLPSQFEIASSAVSSNVTAANLNTLTAGSSSNADALHTHATQSSILFSTTSASANITNTTTETTLIGSVAGNQTIGANYFAAGKTLRVKGWGSSEGGGTYTLTIRVKLDNVTVLSIPATSFGAVPGALFAFEGQVVCRSVGSSGAFYGGGLYTWAEPGSNGNGGRWIGLTSSTADTTSSHTIDVTAQWSGAATQYKITAQMVSVEMI
jgi:hypothetical protein